MDEHLGDLAAVRLVLRCGEHDLNRADHLAGVAVLGNDHNPLATCRALQRADPELLGAFTRQRQHEPDRCAALDTVDEHLGQTLHDGLPVVIVVSARRYSTNANVARRRTSEVLTWRT